MIDIRNPSSLLSLMNAGVVKTLPSRSLNSDFIPSTTKWAFVEYTVRIQATSTITLTGTSNVAGRIELLIATGTPATPADVVCQARSSQTFSGTLIVGVAITITSPEEGLLVGWVAPGQTVRINTVNETGTPTYTLVKAVEYTFA